MRPTVRRRAGACESTQSSAAAAAVPAKARAFAGDPPTTLRILGIDAGVLRTGWGVIERTGARMVALDFGVVRPDPKASLEQRLLVIHDGLAEVLERYAPQVCAIEDVFAQQHARSALILGHARGVALVVVARRALPTFAYPPALVKRSIAGHGGAPKEQMQLVVRAILGLRVTPTHDAADALAVAICHANASRAPATLRR